MLSFENHGKSTMTYEVLFIVAEIPNRFCHDEKLTLSDELKLFWLLRKTKGRSLCKNSFALAPKLWVFSAELFVSRGLWCPLVVGVNNIAFKWKSFRLFTQLTYFFSRFKTMFLFCFDGLDRTSGMKLRHRSIIARASSVWD